MSRKLEKDYYIGLDIGTDSVGWAVTDENYDLVRAKGQDLWGSYLFDAAETAESRRVYRTTRRRLARRRQRLNLLQELFAEEIAKVDPLFFLRINNSAFHAEDKDGSLKTADALFADAGFADREFYKKYPTIYHLRAALRTEEMHDVRLLYLGIHHIIKSRGHFLFQQQDFNVNDETAIKDTFKKIEDFLADLNEDSGDTEDVFRFTDLEQALEILKDERRSKTDKSKSLEKLWGVGSSKQRKAVIKAMTGATVKINELYDEELDGEISSFSFEKEDFLESEFPKLEELLGDRAGLITLLKSVYDWSVLCRIMKDEKYISDVKIKTFNAHRRDLAALKSYVRINCPEKYKNVFRYQKKVNNYAKYIGMDRQKGYGKCTKEEFYAFLKKLPVEDAGILNAMDRGEFLPKQVNTENGIIPYQVHLAELRAILDNCAQYFPFLQNTQGGTTVREKIEALLTFRVPYYVGPLNTASPFAWVKKYDGKERTRITPWNFDEVVDRDASENEFIRRMTNKCTYLRGEDVLPASSFLYSEFTFLNELNNLKVYGEKNAEVNKIIYAYAMDHKKVTLKACLRELVARGMVESGARVEDVFSGTDGDFKNSLNAYNDFKFLGDRRETHREMCEEIILWITLISDKDRLEKRIQETYGDILSKDEIKRLKGLNYSKWGRLSGTLLDGIYSEESKDSDPDTGEMLTIIQAMRLTGENFMQLLSSKHGYTAAINKFNETGTNSDTVTYKKVQELYCSPSAKRSIWRSVEIVKEVIKICGRKPKKIFVEMARDENNNGKKGKRTVSRKAQILELYKNIKEEEHDWIREIESNEDSAFSSDRLVLYYRQLGRCMYTGKPIQLEQVFNSNICDIDHIYPQSKMMDDSLDNRVLVFKTENAKKTDTYPLDASIRTKMRGFWSVLQEKGLISKEKLYRLTRQSPITLEEQADFIQRQLVTTRQSTKAVCEILKKMLPDTEVVYSKAKKVSEFKQGDKSKGEQSHIKIRELNDLHHAKDAYFNIVVGNVYNVRFNHNPRIFYSDYAYSEWSEKNLYRYNIEGAWKVGDRVRILKNAEKNTCRVVRMTSCGKGALFNATIKTAGENDQLIPLKGNAVLQNTEKYGGYDSLSTGYFMLVRSVVKKKNKSAYNLTLEAYPLLWIKQYGEDTASKIRFCTEKLKLVDPVILIEKVKLNTLFCLNGSYAYLRGRTGNSVIWCNANELFLDSQSAVVLKSISEYCSGKKKGLTTFTEDQRNKITPENCLYLYDKLIEKLSSPVYSGLNISGQVPFLQKSRSNFMHLPLEDQCRVIMEVLHLMQCNSTTASLVLLGGVSRAGVITTNKSLGDKNIRMVLQSPTGYYRRIIDFKQYL